MSQTELELELNSKVTTVTPQCDISRLYQQEAVSQILNIFKQHARTHIVMACGTGKTRVALWVAEQLEAKNIVVFVPSLALLSQLMKEWLKVTVWPNVSCLAVCSDETVTYGVDSIIVDPKECNFPVTTEPREIHQFLKNTTDNIRIVFCTYHSSAALSEGIQGCKPFDYGVFDEAHKTAGRSYFGLGVDNQAIPIQKRLFMTATPKHCNINKKNQAGEAKLVYSMDSEALYGPRAYTLSFRQAINLGIITDYKIMISVVSNQQSLRTEFELDGKIVALRKAVLRDPNIAKVITFHQTIDEARSFGFHIQNKQDALPGFTSLHVNSLMPSNSRHDIMHTFQKSGKSIISNARCLTEGIDVPAVDMVAFLNAKKSKIDIVQAIGRAMRKAPGKAYGYVFLPLFVDQDANESLEEAILKADYQDVWEVVQTFSEQDEDLHATLEWLKQQKGKTKDLAPGLEQYLEILSHDSVNISLQKKLERVISIAIIDKIAKNWHEMYGKLMLFKEHYHHTDVPKSYTDKPLSYWVVNQRVRHKKNSLSKHKVKLLEAIGFEWDPLKAFWNCCYEKLKMFKASNNHCNVPPSCSDKLLNTWATRQRELYNKGKLCEDKIKLLETIGFEWNPLEASWYLQYEKLKAFKAMNAHCNVPRGYQRDKCLASWVNAQRHLYKNNSLSTNKIKLLKNIGFEWSPHETSWHLQYEKLKAFKATNKHCNVPMKYQQDRCFGLWMSTQRKRYKNGQLSASKIKLLESIGFKWNLFEASWHRQYEKLKAFKLTNAHCNVPSRYQRDKHLASWVAVQRKDYKNGKLSASKIKLLEAIKFEWKPK